MLKPLAVDLFCGLGGWTDGLLAEGFRVVGFDIEAHHYGEARYPAQLVIQDVLTIHGSRFKDAALIVASPPCTEFSYMAMPWSRAKQIARALRGQDVFPEGYKGSRTVAELTALFDACFRIQREACVAAGRHIPMVLENVRGAQPWVGRAKWNYGSFYLWGDVPALMPRAFRAHFDGSGKSFQSASVVKHGGDPTSPEQRPQGRIRRHREDPRTTREAHRSLLQTGGHMTRRARLYLSSLLYLPLCLFVGVALGESRLRATEPRLVPQRTIPNPTPTAIPVKPGLPYRDMATAAANLCGIEPDLFHGLIVRESSWRQYDDRGRVLRSSSGAYGLVQIKPGTARDVSPTLDIMQPWGNLLAGACHLRSLLDMFGGDTHRALVAYHRGAWGGTAQKSRDYADDILASES